MALPEYEPKRNSPPDELTPKQQKEINKKGEQLYQLILDTFRGKRTTLEQPLRFELLPEDVPNHPEIAGTYGYVYPIIVSERRRESYEHFNGYAGLYLLQPDDNVVYISLHRNGGSLAVIRYERYEGGRVPIKQINFDDYPDFHLHATTFSGEGYDKQKFQRMNETLDFAKNMIEAARKELNKLPSKPVVKDEFFEDDDEFFDFD